MYNEERKREFIRQHTNNEGTAKACEATFAATEKYERYIWKADICTRNEEELQAVLPEIMGMRSTSVPMRLSVLRSYVRWCKNNGIPDVCEDILTIQIDQTERFRTSTVANPLHLEKCFAPIFRSVKEGTIDNTYRCYYWLAYSGMSERDIIKVTTRDVDLNNMVVRFNGKEYPLYRESLAAVNSCMTAETFLLEHSTYSIQKFRGDGNILVRGFGETRTVGSMRGEMTNHIKDARKLGATVMDLSYTNIWVSGLFYRAYEMETAHIPINWCEIVSNFVREDVPIWNKSERWHLYSSDFDKSYSRAVQHKAKYFRKDYESWKSVWH